MTQTTLKEAVPELCDYIVLKQHFEWLIDGPISHIIDRNLGLEIQNMELFLR